VGPAAEGADAKGHVLAVLAAMSAAPGGGT
jgi:hypothetical protein